VKSECVISKVMTGFFWRKYLPSVVYCK
jgi:hypothetical protein